MTSDQIIKQLKAWAELSVWEPKKEKLLVCAEYVELCKEFILAWDLNDEIQMKSIRKKMEAFK
jgi:hypothetical protein